MGIWNLVKVLVGDTLELGKRLPTKTDEFLEKFQTAFDSPPSSFSENYVADFLKSCTALNNQILPY